MTLYRAVLHSTARYHLGAQVALVLSLCTVTLLYGNLYITVPTVHSLMCTHNNTTVNSTQHQLLRSPISTRVVRAHAPVLALTLTVL
jgi:hypothetical protein